MVSIIQEILSRGNTFYKSVRSSVPPYSINFSGCRRDRLGAELDLSQVIWVSQVALPVISIGYPLEDGIGPLIWSIYGYIRVSELMNESLGHSGTRYMGHNRVNFYTEGWNLSADLLTEGWNLSAVAHRRLQEAESRFAQKN